MPLAGVGLQLLLRDSRNVIGAERCWIAVDDLSETALKKNGTPSRKVHERLLEDPRNRLRRYFRRQWKKPRVRFSRPTPRSALTLIRASFQCNLQARVSDLQPYIRSLDNSVLRHRSTQRYRQLDMLVTTKAGAPSIAQAFTDQVKDDDDSRLDRPFPLAGSS
jgi:hypothetical protein